MRWARWAAWALAVAAAVCLAAVLRLRAVAQLPQDYDEPVYFRAAQHYARALVRGQWGELIEYDYNLEHPPFAKLVYALTLAGLPEIDEIPEQPTNPPPPRPYPLPQPQFRASRLTSALFGVLEVLALAVLNPLAGLLLAVHTFTIKYTSQVYLEGVPSLTSFLAALTYARSRGRWGGWLALSAVALGLTAASKYLYAVVGIAIGAHWLWTRWADRPRTGRGMLRWAAPLLIWGLVALVAFYAANPYLWTDPLGRLKASMQFNADFSQSEHVEQSGLPVWQPFVWLMTSVPWHPGVFVVPLDVLITILAVLGLRHLWRERSVHAVWLLAGVGFLLLWPTKWPQYVLILTAPLCVAAAAGARAAVWDPVAGWLRRRRETRRQAVAWAGMRKALPWLVPGAVVLTLIALFPMVYQAAMSLTDFQAVAIRDGLGGGVWREVWRGLTGQVEAVTFDPFSGRGGPGMQKVHYAGWRILGALAGGAAAPLVVYEVLWTVLAVALQAGLGVAVALLLNRPGVRWKGWWRTVFILPWAIPEFVGAMIWAQMLDPRFGWVSLAGRSFPQRMDFPLPLRLATAWQSDPQAALVVLVVAATWLGFPFMFLAATAGLKLIPADVYEAAMIDGAVGWQRFRLVTWPLLLPLLLPAVIIRSILTFNQFYLYYVMQTPSPATTLAVVSFSLFDRGQYAASAAINLFTVAALLGLIVWFDRRSKAAEGVTYA